MSSVLDLKGPPSDPSNVSLAARAESGAPRVQVTIDHEMYPHIMDKILDCVLDEVDREEEEWAMHELALYEKTQLMLFKRSRGIKDDANNQFEESRDSDNSYGHRLDATGKQARPSAWSAWWGLRCSSKEWRDRLDSIYRHIAVETLHYAPRFLCPRTARRLPGLRCSSNDAMRPEFNNGRQPSGWRRDDTVRDARTRALLAHVRVVDAPPYGLLLRGSIYMDGVNKAMTGLEIRRQQSPLWNVSLVAPTVVMMLSMHNLKYWPHVGKMWGATWSISTSLRLQDVHTLVLNLRYYASHKHQNLRKSGWELRGRFPKTLVIILSPYTIPTRLKQYHYSPSAHSVYRQPNARLGPNIWVDSDEASDHEPGDFTANASWERHPYRCFLDMFLLRNILGHDSESLEQTVITIVGADELDPAWFRLPHTLSWEERKKALVDGWQLSDHQHKRLAFVSRAEYQARVGAETYACYTSSSLPIPRGPDGDDPVVLKRVFEEPKDCFNGFCKGFYGWCGQYLFSQDDSEPRSTTEFAWGLPIPPAGTRVPAKSTTRW